MYEWNVKICRVDGDSPLAADLAQLLQTSRVKVVPAAWVLGVRPRDNAGPIERMPTETDRHLSQRRERVAPERGELRREVIGRQSQVIRLWAPRLWVPSWRRMGKAEMPASGRLCYLCVR